MKKWIRSLIMITLICITIGIISLLGHYIHSDKTITINLNEFRDTVLKGGFASIEIFGNTAECAVDKNVLGNNVSNMSVILPLQDKSDWINLILQQNIPVQIVHQEEKISFMTGLINIVGGTFSTVIYFCFIYYMFRGDGLNSSPYTFIRSTTNFSDVAGMELVKREVMEVVDFLKNPAKYRTLRCRTPKGVLLSGPPGNGKTLIAKAIAGEAGVNFISASASSFLAMFVGTGAKNVRELFATARQNGPCVIFLDEMDSLGSREDISGGHSEQKKTINQFLAEMDGVEENTGVIVIGATNNPDAIDKAALRSGRFDRQVSVANPSFKERLLVLNLYCSRVPLDYSVNLDLMARNTAGFSRADIENLVNEAKIFATRTGNKYLNAEDFKKALDKIMLGLPGEIKQGKELKNTAFHESGHAFMMFFYQKILGKIYKATIVPHGMKGGTALGFVMPENNDLSSLNKEQYEAKIQICLAGRIAEEMFFGIQNVTTGCSNDLQQARRLAEKYVIFGLEPDYKLKYLTQEKNYISETQRDGINRAVDQLIDDMEIKTRYIMKKNKKLISKLGEILLKEETLTGEQIDNILLEKIFLPAPYKIIQTVNINK